MTEKPDYRRRRRRARESMDRRQQLADLTEARTTHVGKPSKPKSSVYITVADGAGLAAEIRREIDKRHAGNVSRAADAAGMSQSTLQRLVTGQAKRISADTLSRLHAFLPGEGRGWGRMLVAQPTTDAMIAYSSWMDSVRQQMFEDNVLPSQAIGPLEWRGTEKELHALVTRSRSVAPDAFLDWEAQMHSSSLFKQRPLIALLRIFEPLLHYGDTSGIERHWLELADDELADFVRAGMRRELILLARDADFTRAERAAEKPLELPTIGKALGRELWRLDHLTEEWLVPPRKSGG